MHTYCLAALLLCPGLAFAAAPVKIPHSGYLLGPNDAPLTATLAASFAIYDAASGGTVRWQGSCPLAVSGGSFATVLGEGACAGDGLDTDDVPPGELRWLSITVDGATLAPRLALYTASTALLAADAQRLGGVEARDFLRRSELAAGAGLTLSGGTLAIGPGAVTESMLAGGIPITKLAAPVATLDSGGHVPVSILPRGTGPGTVAAGDDPRLVGAITASGTAGGDLAHTWSSPLVVGLQGVPVSATAPAPGQILAFDATSAAWRPLTPSIAATPPVVTLTDAPLVAVDAAAGSVFELTLKGNRTLGAPIGLRDGVQYVFRIRQDASGGRALAFASAYDFLGRTPEVGDAPGAVSLFAFLSDGHVLHAAWSNMGPHATCAATTQTFVWTGADQTYTVPAACRTLKVQAWGAGGASALDADDRGGGGAFVSASLPVSPGETLTIVVGGGGTAGRPGRGGYGGGGDSGGPGAYDAPVVGAGGGGRSAIRSTAGTELLTAAGGGGSGASGSEATNGGGGGGPFGQAGSVLDTWAGGGDLGGAQASGRGASTTSGGAGATGGTQWSGPGEAGAALRGGTGSAGTGWWYAGGGGGGGFFGGGGGSGTTGFAGSGGGGGGSSQAIASATQVVMQGGSGSTPGNASAAERGGAGQGGSPGGGAGAHGRVIVTASE